MKKWNVSIPLYATACYRVEAETEENAINEAYKLGLPGLCHQCSRELEIDGFGDDADPIAEED